MKERTLLDLVGKIDDSLIEEAAHPEILLARQRKRRRAHLARRVGSIAACFVIAIGVIVAIPSLRMMEKVQAEADMNSAISDALNEQVNAEASKQAAVESMEAAIAEAEAALSAAESSLAAAQAEASKAAAEASKAAADAEKKASEAAASASKVVLEASKAAAEASKAAAEASKASASAEAAITTKSNTVTTMTPEPTAEIYKMGELTYTYLDQILYSLEVASDYRLIDLVLPAEIAGVKLTELDSDFWRFCDANPNLKTVTIPESIMVFGHVEYLNREVEIICVKDSAAEKFFIEKGYTVKNP